MNIPIEFRPIEYWPRAHAEFRTSSRFKASYQDTLDLLDRELFQIDARDVVLQAAFLLRDIRRDGQLRAGAWPTHPGIILSCETAKGPLQMPCDTFDNWQDNVRAIALSLESLRRVDRYGVTSNGEQYKGWTRLGNGEKPAFASKEAAISFLSRIVDGDILKMPRDWARRAAERKSHPDTGGTNEEFKAVQAALKMIGF